MPSPEDYQRAAGYRRSHASHAPRAALQSDGPGTLITTPQDLEDALRHGNVSSAGVAVTPNKALRVAAVYACVRLRCGPIANMPLNVLRRVDARTREDASDHHAWQLLRRKPNKWQKPNQFKRMMQAHVLLRGNGYAYKVPGVGKRIQALIPLHPDQVKTKQASDFSITHEWTRPDGKTVTLKQDEVLHLFGLTLNGFTGVTPLTYARETVGLSLSMDGHVGKVMRKGARSAGALSTEKSLSDKAYNHLKESLAEYTDGGTKEGEFLLLEEGLRYDKISMTPQDLQWIESRKLSISEIAMYFGCPPHMIGQTEKSTSWGTGIEQQTQGFLAYTSLDDVVMWEEAATADLIDEADIYAKFNLGALSRADLKSRYAAYMIGRNGGWLSKNDIREKEDMNPIEGGDDYDAPLNSNAKPADGSQQNDEQN